MLKRKISHKKIRHLKLFFFLMNICYFEMSLHQFIMKGQINEKKIRFVSGNNK